jgi:hypothetical protein
MLEEIQGSGVKLKYTDLSAKRKVMLDYVTDIDYLDGSPVRISALEQQMKLAIGYLFKDKPPVIVLYNVTIDRQRIGLRKTGIIEIPGRTYRFYGHSMRFKRIDSLSLAYDMVFATYSSIGIYTRFNHLDIVIVFPMRTESYICRAMYDSYNRRILVTYLHLYVVCQARWKCLRMKTFRDHSPSSLKTVISTGVGVQKSFVILPSGNLFLLRGGSWYLHMPHT